MAALTNYLPVKIKTEEKKYEQYVEKLRNLRNAVETISNTFDYDIPRDSELGQVILETEESIFEDFWDDVGFIPNDFPYSCLNTKEDYNCLYNLSFYPVVEIGDLKKLVDTLSLAILPIEYININKLFESYPSKNCSYENRLKDFYKTYKTITSRCEEFIGKQILYIVAPISCYDPYLEASHEEFLPKYFSQKLSQLSTILGLIMPTQRNLYQVLDSTSCSLDDLETMKNNFQAVRKTISACHKQLDWVRDIKNLGEMKSDASDTEVRAFSKLTPIIFSVDENIDISEPNADDKNARIAQCFGIDIPDKFFEKMGLTPIDSNAELEKITHTYIL